MIKNKISVIAALLVLGSSAYATDWVNNGKISGSPHDLSATTTGVAANGELCVFCHTPHAANSQFTGAPLWNKAATVGTTTYRLYGSSNPDEQGQTIAGTKVGDAAGDLSSPSLACLSCHDGVSAINSIVNAPGSGSTKDSVNGTGFTAVTIGAISTPYGGNIGAGGLADVDMSNDHPVSVKYMGTGTGNNAEAGSPASLRPTDALLTNWVGANSGGAGVGAISDILRNGNVECSSCHDPHNGYATQGTDPQVNYLRHTNAASALCLGCHDK